MNPTSAAALIGFALALLTMHRAERAIRVAGLALVSFGFLIGLLRLVPEEWMAFRADLLLFPEEVATVTFNSIPARLSLSSALCAVVFSVGFVLSHFRQTVRVSQHLAMAVGFMAWLSALGYLYAVPEYYGEVTFLPMAVPSAVCYLLISFALFAAHEDDGLAEILFSELHGSRSARVLLASVVLIPLAMGYFRLWGHWLQLFSVEFGVALLVLMVTVLLASVVIVHIKTQNRRHKEQIRYEGELNSLNRVLTDRNEEVSTLLEEVQSSNEKLHGANEELAALNDELQEAWAQLREQTDRSLRLKDEQLNRTVEATDLVIWSIDLTGKGNHFMSRTFENVMGIPAREFLQTPVDSWNRILVREDREKRDQALAELHAKGTSRAVLRVVDRNGMLRYFDTQQLIVKDETGTPLRQEGVAMDITHVKMSEQSLIAERRLLRSVIDNIPDYIFVKDESMRHIINNKANVELLGAKSEAETLGKTVMDYVGEAGRQLMEDDKRVIATGDPIVNRQEYLPDKTGKVRTLLTTKVPLRDDNGKITRIVGISRDITDLLRREMELSRYRENMEIIFTNTMEEIYLLNNEGQVVVFNEAASRFIAASTGRKLEVGKYLWEVVDPDRSEIVRSYFNRSVSGEDLIDEARVVLPSGVVYREMHYEPVRKAGEVKYVSVISLDITSKKERDAQREKTEHEKSILVEQLINQNNDLLQFSFIASHNLRGPVASVLGLLNLMKSHEIPEGTAMLISMLRQSVNRLDSVIKDLSKILEMRSGQVHAREFVEIRQVIGTIQVELQQQIAESSATITLDDAAVSDFFTIKSYYHSILHNLVSNAIKYRSRIRPPVIHIKTFQTPAEYGFIISDNGLGIDLERFGDKVFGMYQRFHIEVEGKGIGLYMVKMQVQLLRGTITIQSKPDEGATFTVSFPYEPLVA